MTRTLLAAVAAVALLGCPLPQPLPDYPPGTITPPRILGDGIQVDGVPSTSQAVILVPAGCAKEPSYALSAVIHDTNTIEQVETRWFVNYAPSPPIYSTVWHADTVLADPDPLVLTRSVPPRDPETQAERPWQFKPYDYRPPAGVPAPGPGPKYPEAGILRVVELVVSNGFDPAGTLLPQRQPRLDFETQTFRWVFLTVPESQGCTRGEPGCVLCPE